MRGSWCGWDRVIAQHVHRERLVELSSSGHVIGLEAPSGAGKSTLMDQLAAAHDGPVLAAALTADQRTRSQVLRRLERSVREHGLNDLVAAISQHDEREPLGALLRWSDRNDERLLVLLDDVHYADDDLGRFLADLGDRWPSPHRLVIAGRRLPDPVRRCLVGADRVRIGTDDLRFHPDEVRELLELTVDDPLDADEVALITSGCDGWAAAVGLLADRLRRASPGDLADVIREAIEPAHRRSMVADLIDALLDSSPDGVRPAIAQLSVLPLVDERIVRLAGLRGSDELTDLGIPLEASGAGRWVFPDVVRDAVRPPERDEELTRGAAHHYIADGRLEESLEVLRAAGLEDDLVDLLAELPPRLLGQLDAAVHADVVASVAHRSLVERPRILLHLADSYLLAGRTQAYAETVERAAALLDEREVVGIGRDEEALEVRAVALTVRIVASNDDRLLDDARELLARTDLLPMPRARLRAAAGRATATRRTVPALREAAREIGAAARSFEREGAVVHAAATDLIAATFASIPLGRYDAALEQLDRVLAASTRDPMVRVATLPYRAFVLVALGRYAEAEAVLAELRRTATTTGLIGNERSAAFARWAAARMASQQEDADTTWAACRAVERSEVSVDTANGAYFRADAAQLLARVGCYDEAERLLEEARTLDDGVTEHIDLGAYALAAYRGDHERAMEMLDRLGGGETVEPRMRWRVTLLHAYVSHRAGDAAARPLAAAAFEEAAQLGYPDLPLVQEPALARELLPLARDGSASARDVTLSHGSRVRLLGRFEVEHDGRRSEPVGRPAQLIAYLALHDGQASAERIIDALWPESDPERGRERLRTVLRRVRRDHGDLVHRSEGTLRLDEHVTVDVEEFLRFCSRAHAPSTDRAQAASAALALHRGEPAPGIAHLDWVASSRRHLEDRVLAMHDVVADEAAADERLDDAIRSLLDALRLDPIAEHRYLAAARLLAEQGRRARALQLLDDACSALASAGLEPSSELRLLNDYLSRRPSSTRAS